MNAENADLDVRAGAAPVHYNPPPMPPGLVVAFTRNRPRRDSDGDGAAIPEGGRDAYLASLAGTMRRRGMTQKEIGAALATVNATRCEPPLDDRDVQRIAWSVGRYDHEDELLDRLARGEAQLDASGVQEDADAVFERAGFGWLDVERVLQEDPPPFDWLWQGFIERRELLWLSGAGKTGKSMLALFLACAALAGRPSFLGVPLGRLEHLVYLDAENPAKTVHRRLHLAGVPAELAPRIRYGVIRSADLGSEAGLRALDLAVRDRPGALLVLDSLIGLHTADEDKAGEVRRLVTGIRKVAEANDLTVLGLVHESHAGRTRGSTDWLNASDGTLRVSIEGDPERGDAAWRKVAAVNRRDGGNSSDGGHLYRFREARDGDRRRLQLVTSNGVEGGGGEQADAPAGGEGDAGGEVADYVAGIVRLISADPAAFTMRALAQRLGTSHSARPFRRALELAARESPAVDVWWQDKRRRGTS